MNNQVITRFLVTVLLAFNLQVVAQVGINTDNSQPDPSAMLDVKSTAKGFLPPRMTLQERNAIQNPIIGLMIYCTNCGRLGSEGALSVFTNSGWSTMWPCIINPVNSSTHTISPGQIIWRWNGTSSGVKWNTAYDFDNAINLGYAVSKTETGILCGQTYTRYVWNYSECGVAGVTSLTVTTAPLVPDAPVAGSHVSSMFQITWSWNAVAGAIGYKWSITDDFSSAIEMGTNLNRTETGLICNTLYTRYIWAYNACGVSSSSVITASTSPPPNAPTEGVHVPSFTQIIWKWSSVTNATGYKWNSVNNYSTATNMGTNLQKTESGLTCNTAYVRYIWAYNNACVSQITTITGSTLPLPTNPVEGTHESALYQITWNWGAVSGATGYKWNTVNNYSTATDLGNVATKIETGLNCNTAYTRYLWAFNNCGGTVSPTILTQSTQDCPANCQPFTDTRNGKNYNTVLIGTQCWMKENLNIGTLITVYQANNQIIEKYCPYNLESNCDIYGGLYMWNEAMQYVTTPGVQGICPAGWHLPSDPEWCTLTMYLDPTVNCSSTVLTGTDAGGKMKEAGTTHWVSPNTGAINSSGFTALPGGVGNEGTTGGFLYNAHFWSSTQWSSADWAWKWQLNHDGANVGRHYDYKVWGLSVRCIKD